MSKKANPPNWADWKGKTQEERWEWYGKQSPARQELFIRQARKEQARLHALCLEDQDRDAATNGNDAKRRMSIYRRHYDENGIRELHPWALLGLQSEEDERVVNGKAEGDPAPPFGSPLGDKFLLSQGDQGSRLGEELRRLHAEIESLASKLDLGPFIFSGELKGARKEPPESDKRRLAELCTDQRKAYGRYLKLWDRAKNVGVTHPLVEKAKLIESIKDAPIIIVPIEEYTRPAYVHRLTKEDIARQAEEQAQSVKEYEEAEKRKRIRQEEYPRQFGRAGGADGNLAGDEKILKLARSLQGEGKSERQAAELIAKAPRVSVGVEAIRKKLAVWVQKGRLLPFSGKPGPRPNLKKKRVRVRGG